ncbi:phage antirepressor [Schaalia sp. ZJ405]|uniref:phage antirepressor n=1 Tax=Schaalia sp. ZJ405 TaxID=2709403 RepID=UPI0018C98644|nr:phage antirepressor [Schaalia sp. ZJ405]QPK80789.1 phage antirepressor [Schaalia sp. ZJ405]
MNELMPFNYKGSSVRVLTGADGQPWFVAADVARILEIGNPSQAMTRLDDDERTLISNEGHDLNVVSEAGLYSLILGSRKPEAKAFKRWVTHEVLPTIRKTGSYGNPLVELTGPELMARALIEAQATLAAAQQRAITAETKVVELAPKARQFDNFLNAEGDYSVTQAAQALNRAGAKTGRNRLHATLEALKWIYKPKGHRHWRVYQTASDRGLLRLRPTTWRDQHTGVEHAAHTIRVTPKGLDALARHFGVTITPADIEGDTDAA